MLILTPAVSLSGAAADENARANRGAEVAPGVFLAGVEAASTPTGATAPPRAQGTRTREPRIVGGTTTTIEEWPWQVAVADNPALYSGNGFQRQFCGGSLVAPTIVITAAHCAFDVFDGGNDFDDPENFSVITGRTTLSSSQGQEIDVDSIWFPANGMGQRLYNPNTDEWDAIVLVLASPSSSGTIKIAGADETALWAADSVAWATGWGTTSSGGSRSDTLREVQFHMIADSTCGSPTVYGSEFKAQTMVCAGELTGGKDTCQGDSGGPLTVPMAGGGFRLVGDTSWGFGCALPNNPGVYGRLAADPMRTVFRNAILGLAGVDVVGSGGTPPAVPSSTDTDSPETTITKHPKKHVESSQQKVSVRFKFSSDEAGSSFQCRLDQRPLRSCSGPRDYRVGTPDNPRKHLFKVFATDPAGNRDPTPGKFRFRASS
ncbi:MAG: serine protease [Actinomycetota bacterium]